MNEKYDLAYVTSLATGSIPDIVSVATDGKELEKTNLRSARRKAERLVEELKRIEDVED